MSTLVSTAPVLRSCSFLVLKGCVCDPPPVTVHARFTMAFAQRTTRGTEYGFVHGVAIRIAAIWMLRITRILVGSAIFQRLFYPVARFLFCSIARRRMSEEALLLPFYTEAAVDTGHDNYHRNQHTAEYTYTHEAKTEQTTSALQSCCSDRQQDLTISYV